MIVKFYLTLILFCLSVGLKAQNDITVINCDEQDFKECLSSYFEKALTKYMSTLRCLYAVRSTIEIELFFELARDGELTYKILDYKGVRPCGPKLQEWFKEFIANHRVATVPTNSHGDIRISYSFN